MPQVPEGEPARLADQIPSAYAKFAQVYQSRCATAMQDYVEATGEAAGAWLDGRRAGGRDRLRPLRPPTISRAEAVIGHGDADRRRKRDPVTVTSRQCADGRGLPADA